MEPNIFDTALKILAQRELAGESLLVAAEEVIDALRWEHSYSNYMIIVLSLPRNGFISVTAGTFTLWLVSASHSSSW